MADRGVRSVAEHLKICHVNSQSLYAHIDEFRHYFLVEKYHIICLSETWLKPEIPDEMVSLQDYSLHRIDRVGKRAGELIELVRELPFFSTIL